MQGLTDKTVIVTGGAGGIGSATTPRVGGIPPRPINRP